MTESILQKQKEVFHIPRQILSHYKKTMLGRIKEVFHGSAEPAKVQLTDLQENLILWFNSQFIWSLFYLS